jgi:hypothetical protein
MRKSKSKPLKVVDLGTSPHGLSAGLRDMSQETCCTDSLLSLADAFAVLGEELRFSVLTSACSAERSSSGGRSCAQPEAASEAAKAKRLPFHYLELTDCEYLTIRQAIENWRHDTRKAISKGKAVSADLASTDSLWSKLQEVMALRMQEVAL